MVTKENVAKYMWPHLDYGKSQYAYNDLRRNHGDKRTIVWEDSQGKHLSKETCVFRLLDANLYDEEWVKEALPIAKQIWEEKRKELDNQDSK